MVSNPSFSSYYMAWISDDTSEPRSLHRDNGSNYCTYLLGLLSESNKIMLMYIKKDLGICKQILKRTKKKCLEKI